MTTDKTSAKLNMPTLVRLKKIKARLEDESNYEKKVTFDSIINVLLDKAGDKVELKDFELKKKSKK